MSRIGKLPISIAPGLTVKIDGLTVEVTGPKGTLKRTFRPEVGITQEGTSLLVTRKTNTRVGRALHGLTRSLLANMLQGVSQGYSKSLKIVGTGYRVRLDGANLVLNCGFSHPVTIKPATGITFSTENTDMIIITGADKEMVGQVAAQIRSVKPPEPYKGKGLRYLDEHVRHKAGKAGKTGAAAGA